ncbi:MAG: hypothetical protein FJW31_08745 [Acidobacteria bacterium]|nr:hypothetical protein [Acidobacteriota bacterium]
MSSILLYSLGLFALVALGFVALPVPPATRSRALAVFLGSLAGILAVLWWPAPPSRTARGKRLIDQALPRYQFAERHRTRICASPERILASVGEVTGEEIRLLDLLFALRGFRRDGEDADKPLLLAMTESGFVSLTEGAGEELLVATAGEFWRYTGPLSANHELRRQLDAFRGNLAGFAAWNAGGMPRAVINFIVEPADLGCQSLTTETRIGIANPEMAARFASYWRVIQPGSALLRRSWLDAIRRRAERGQ